MDEALVEDAEYEVDHHDRQQDQDAHAFEGGLVGLRGAGEGAGERGRHLQLAHARLHLCNRLRQRDARAQIEGEGHRR